MKDYKLSEIKKICEKANYECKNCEFGEYRWIGNYYACLLQYSPRLWQIDEEDPEDDQRDN